MKNVLAVATGVADGMNLGLNARAGLITRGLNEMLRLNMDVAPCGMDCSTLGAIDGDVAGFPNGRRLSDDIM